MHEGEELEWHDAIPNDQIFAPSRSAPQWPVPPIVGVIETPTMRPDGSILDVPGYDAATGYLYAAHARVSARSPNPTWHDANVALNALLEPWMDFPWADPVMCYVPVANQLTIQVRPAIEGEVPGFGTTPASAAVGSRSREVCGHPGAGSRTPRLRLGHATKKS